MPAEQTSASMRPNLSTIRCIVCLTESSLLTSQAEAVSIGGIDQLKSMFAKGQVAKGTEILLIRRGRDGALLIECGVRRGDRGRADLAGRAARQRLRSRAQP